MKQEAFEARHAETWDRFAHWIDVLGNRGAAARETAEARAAIGREFPALYRQVCHHLALSRARRYSLALQHRLNALALDGHQHLYRARTAFLGTLGRFFARDFPAAFRRQWRFMLVSGLLFSLSGIGMAVAIQLQPDLVYSLLAPQDVSGMEEMYDPENRVLGRERESDTDVSMFGVYIYNNISIGFQTFAGGLLFGVGSVFFLCFNGLVIGAVASHLTAAGFTETFWTFVAGHSSLELTAIVIFGAVGLMIGFGATAPGRKKRWHAVRDRAHEGLPLIYGGTAMLVGAAFVEAFWSSTTWPPATVKYSVGIVLWLSVAAYFWACGRHESR